VAKLGLCASIESYVSLPYHLVLTMGVCHSPCHRHCSGSGSTYTALQMVVCTVQ